MKKNTIRLDGYFVSLMSLLLIGYVAIFSYLFYRFPDLYPIYSFYLFLLTALAIDGVKIIIESFTKKHVHKIKTDQEKITVIIACHNGADTIFETVRKTINALPRSKILVANDASTDNSAELAEKAGAEVFTVPKNLGKVRVIHEALSRVRTPFVLVMDDDTEITGVKIPTNLLATHDAVAFRVLPYGNSLLSHLQRHEYRKSMEIGRSFHARSGTIPCVSGAIGLFTKDSLLRQTDLHTGEFSGEDLQRTLLIHRHDNDRGVTFVDQVVYTHAPVNLRDLYLQRTHGWWPGLWNNFGHFVRFAFGKKVNWRLRYDSLYVLFLILTDPFRIMALPTLFSSFGRLAVFYGFYVLLELIPYLRMGRKESFLVVLLAPIYGVLELFARFIAFFAWIYRRAVSAINWNERAPDHYRRASLPHQVFAFVAGVVVMTGLLSSSGYLALNGQGNILSADQPATNQVTTEVAAETEVATPVVVQEKVYTATAEAGDGFMVIARKMIAEYRNDFGGYEDPVTRLYAEDRLGRSLEADFSNVDPGDSFSLTQNQIQQQLETGTHLSPTLYIALQGYLTG